MKRYVSAFLALCMVCSSLSATPVKAAEKKSTTGTFKVASMNVDGMPNTISVNNIYNYKLNSDGPGAEGTKAISKKMSTYGWDLIAVSEDFNFESELKSSMTAYSFGTNRGGIPTNWSIFKLPDWPLTTDGLNIIWKKENVNVSGEKFVSWETKYGTDVNVVVAKIPAGNGADNMIDKGYRFYQAEIDGVMLDVYTLHMDADSSEGDIAARNAELTQLATTIKASNNGNPILVMGDTNCRYTREKIQELFINSINADARFTVQDAWVEKTWSGKYPVYGSDAMVAIDHDGTYNYPEAEIVDKIFYINNTDSDVTLSANSYTVQTDFTDDKGNPLADHWPIVVDFTYTIEGEGQHEHNYIVASEKPANCGIEGSRTYSCDCGDSYTEVLPALEHQYSVSSMINGTCQTIAKFEYTCKNCGDVINEDGGLGAHQYNAVVTAPSCTEEGFTTHTCSLCGDTYVDSKVAAVGHKLVKGTCSVCGWTDPDYTKGNGTAYTLGSPVTEIESGKKYGIVFESATPYALSHSENGTVSATEFECEAGSDVADNLIWTVSEQDGGYTIATEVNGQKKYLARTKTLTNGGYKIDLQDNAFIWKKTIDSDKKCIRFSTKIVNSNHYLRYYTAKTGWIVSTKGAGLTIYEINE